MSLALPANSSDASLWFVPADAGLVTWQQTGCEVDRVQTSSSLLSTSLDGSGSGAPALNAAVQTPIAVPTGSGLPAPHRNRSRRCESRRTP